MITMKVINNRVAVGVQVGDNHVQRVFAIESWWSMRVTPHNLDQTIARALKWGHEMEAMLLRVSGKLNGRVVVGPGEPAFRSGPLTASGYVDLEKKIASAEPDTVKGFSTATTVAAITGSVGVGAAVGIVNGGDLVDSAVGGLVGAGIDKFLGGE